jgi:hypothetical protein
VHPTASFLGAISRVWREPISGEKRKEINVKVEGRKHKEGRRGRREEERGGERRKGAGMNRDRSSEVYYKWR